MKTFSIQFEELKEQAIDKIRDLIKSKGKESKHSNKRCLKVTKDDLQFNLGGGRYLTEINAETLVDNDGYEYNFYVLSTEDFLSVTDYLIAQYK
jgi:methyl coenzyme M reductase subunit D